MSKVRITRNNIQQYIDSGQIDPSKVQIDLNKTKTANDNVERWVTLQSAIDSGYDFDFNYELKEPKKKQETVKIEPQDLDEFVVVGTKSKPSYNFGTALEIPMFSEKRRQSQIANPKAVAVTENTLGAVGEFIDTSTGGILKLLSPSHDTGLVASMLNGESVNPFDVSSKWYQNSGLFELPILQKYQNHWSVPWINLLADVGVGYGGVKFVQYGDKWIPFDAGAESTVSKRLFSPGIVRKVSNIPPEEMVRRNTYNVQSKLIGRTPEGQYIYEQIELEPLKQELTIKDLMQLGKRTNTYPVKKFGEWMLYNPYKEEYLIDLNNNVGKLPRRNWLYPFDAVPVNDKELSFIMAKKGSKLIPRLKKFQTGGQIPKFQNSGILEAIKDIGKKVWYWRSPDYTGISFNKAFKSAKDFGEEDFWWNGNIYNTKLKEQSSEIKTPTLTKSPLNTKLSRRQYELASDIWRYLYDKKVSPRNISVIMGNIMQESSFNRNAKQQGGDRAEGLFQMHSDDLKAYNKWKANNKTGKYPELDYILYMINSKDHPYTNEYKRINNLPKTRQNQEYIQKVYGDRIKNNTLYLIDDFNSAWNDESYSLNDITDLFTNTIERAGKPEYETRRAYAKDFYNHFYGQ